MRVVSSQLYRPVYSIVADTCRQCWPLLGECRVQIADGKLERDRETQIDIIRRNYLLTLGNRINDISNEFCRAIDIIR